MNRSRPTDHRDWDDDETEDGRGSDLGGSFSVDGMQIELDGAPAGSGEALETPSVNASGDGMIRLQKALANAGVASRRAAESLIVKGRVTVNGQVVTELGSRIDPEHDVIAVNGVVLQLDETKRYFVLNKPRGVVSTMSDENGRPDLREFTDLVRERLYNVGRLDTDTSGLLVLTNDGDLANVLAHPRYGVEKTYIARVRGRVAPATVQRLKSGVELEDGVIRCDAARLLPNGQSPTDSLVEVTLHSGKNRIVRRMLAEVGHPVTELVRRQFGPLHLGSLLVGEMRELSAPERGALLTILRDANEQGQAQQGQPKQAGKKQRPIRAGRPGDGKGAYHTGNGRPGGKSRGARAQAERDGRDERESQDERNRKPRASGSGKATRGKNVAQRRGNSPQQGDAPAQQRGTTGKARTDFTKPRAAKDRERSAGSESARHPHERQGNDRRSSDQTNTNRQSNDRNTPRGEQ